MSDELNPETVNPPEEDLDEGKVEEPVEPEPQSGWVGRGKDNN